MKHETDFTPLEPQFGKLPDAPLPMPKQDLSPPRGWFASLLMLLTLARSRS